MTDILNVLDDIEDDENEENTEESKDSAPESELTSESKSDDVVDNGDNNDDLSIDEEERVEDDEDVLSESKARDITEAIKSVATATYALLYEAYEYKAHKALGYKSWADYVTQEFEMSRSRSYQLIAQAETIKMIEEAVPEGTKVKLTEAQVRDLKSELPRITKTIEEKTSDMSPEEAEALVNELIESEREQARADKEAIDRKKAAQEQAENEGYHNALDDVADSIIANGEEAPEKPDYDKPSYDFNEEDVNDFSDEADSGIIEHEVEGNQTISSEDALNIYNFFNALSQVSSLPEPEDLLDILPDERKKEVDNQLTEATAWFNRAHTLWENRWDS